MPTLVILGPGPSRLSRDILEIRPHDPPQFQVMRGHESIPRQTHSLPLLVDLLVDLPDASFVAESLLFLGTRLLLPQVVEFEIGESCHWCVYGTTGGPGRATSDVTSPPRRLTGASGPRTCEPPTPALTLRECRYIAFERLREEGWEWQKTLHVVRIGT